MKTKLFFTAILFLMFHYSFAQLTTAQAQQLKDVETWIKKQDTKIFRFGLSIGVRTGFGSENSGRAIVSIIPTDYTVRVEHDDLMAVLLSTSITAYPFQNWWKYLGFTANVNLLEFTNAQANTPFNKPIDGGIGLAIALDKEKKFAFAITFERTSTRKPKQWVVDNEGNTIVVNGEIVTSIDKNDDNYFVNTGLNAIAFKFIYSFN